MNTVMAADSAQSELPRTELQPPLISEAAWDFPNLRGSAADSVTLEHEHSHAFVTQQRQGASSHYFVRPLGVESSPCPDHARLCPVPEGLGRVCTNSVYAPGSGSANALLRPLARLPRLLSRAGKTV